MSTKFAAENIVVVYDHINEEQHFFRGPEFAENADLHDNFAAGALTVHVIADGEVFCLDDSSTDLTDPECCFWVKRDLPTLA